MIGEEPSAPLHRRPPMPPLFDSVKQAGHCRWCARPIWLDQRRLRVNRRRSWHPDCLDQYLLLTRPERMRIFIWQRDQGRCYICGRVHKATIRALVEYGDGDRFALLSEWAYTLITFDIPNTWDVEHKVPLWKVAALPDVERIKYFLPDNAALACRRPCHEEKSRREAAERAKFDRLADRKEGRPRSKAARRNEQIKRWRDMP